MATITINFAGSSQNAGNYYGFSFYLNSEGASTTVSVSCSLTSIYFGSTTGTSTHTTPVYLNVWKMDSGETTYTYLGSSTNSDYCSTSKSATWNFNSLTINPTSKYVVIFSSGNSSSSWNFGQYGRIPVYPVTNDALHTVYTYNPGNPPTTSQAWAPKMSLTLTGEFNPHTDINAKMKIKIMPASILETEVISNDTFYVNNDTKQLYLGSKLIVGSPISIEGSSAPTSSTEGIIGQNYIDTTNQDAYICVGASSGTYTWKKITV